MYIHDLIEDMKTNHGYNKNKDEYEEIFDMTNTIHLLESTEVYYLDNLTKLIQLANKELSFELSDFGTTLRAPFSNILIEGMYQDVTKLMKICLLLVEKPEYHELKIFYRNKDLQGNAWVLAAYRILINPKIDMNGEEANQRFKHDTCIQFNDNVYLLITTSTIVEFMKDGQFEKSQVFEDLQMLGYKALLFLETSLRIMACKNIIVEKINPPAKLNKKRIAKNKQPMLPYNIFKVTRNGIKTKGGQLTLETKELTHCPGHFKTYTSEAPLFGKHVGTWWWSPWIKEGFESQYRERQVEYKP